VSSDARIRRSAQDGSSTFSNSRIVGHSEVSVEKLARRGKVLAIPLKLALMDRGPKT